MWNGLKHGYLYGDNTWFQAPLLTIEEKLHDFTAYGPTRHWAIYTVRALATPYSRNKLDPTKMDIHTVITLIRFIRSFLGINLTLLTELEIFEAQAQEGAQQRDQGILDRVRMTKNELE